MKTFDIRKCSIQKAKISVSFWTRMLSSFFFVKVLLDWEIVALNRATCSVGLKRTSPVDRNVPQGVESLGMKKLHVRLNTDDILSLFWF